MDKALYAEWLESRLEKAEAEVARVRAELELTRRSLESDAAQRVALADPGRLSPNWAPPSKEREERRAEDAALTFEVTPHVSARVEEPTKRLSEAEKRAFLMAHGWTEHNEIAEQNIRVCWENGGKWQTLEDAYELATTEIAKQRLRADGWTSTVDPIDEIERWRRAGSDFVLFHEACAQLAPAEPGALS